MLAVVLSFFLVTRASDREGGHWVVNSTALKRKYLKGWFLIDVLSVMPLWASSLNYSQPFGIGDQSLASMLSNRSMTAAAGDDGPPDNSRVAVLLRLMKLLRHPAIRPWRQRRRFAVCSRSCSA